ncbi:hypothetical protein [Bradyrhizobium sp. AS23.2]|uniref:hypothetical protein n=1 Tax=Bradyrhizobium sp. AS23.2 TaxID=1680155 RepID=UPI00093A5053|nr:hypothetical protein [Bradyrhizobium sp. AS23.2]OKO69274.1 hypothetical protein AC630_37230 [Bradyrhizobium sp. AS23.2]
MKVIGQQLRASLRLEPEQPESLRAQIQRLRELEERSPLTRSLWRAWWKRQLMQTEGPFRVTSVVRCDRRRPDDFRYAPVSDQGRMAVQYVAKGQNLTVPRGQIVQKDFRS